MNLCNRCFLFLVSGVVSVNTFANPQGGTVAGGSVQISSPNPSTLLIDQSTQKGIINWQSFNIQKGQTTQFNQPNSSAITLNRINGLNGPSSIFGNLVSNGQVWLINPAGIVFGHSAQVNVGGILATTSDIKDQDFLSGNYKFFANSQTNTGSIVNKGQIRVQPGGLVALVGNAVDNKGYIQAKMGTVILGGAQAYTLDFDGDQLINFTIQQGPSGKATYTSGKKTSNTVTNSGVVDTGVGAVLTPKGARRLVQSSINMSGVSEANHVYAKGGSIILDAGGGHAKVSGKLLARNGSITVRAHSIKTKNAQMVVGGGLSNGEINLLSHAELTISNSTLNANGLHQGGTIHVLGDHIKITGSQISANGNTGGGNIFIGGNAHGIGPLLNASSVYVDSGSSVSANALLNGSGGDIVVWSNENTQVHGDFAATGGLSGGNGGWIETSGGYLNIAGIKVNLLADQGETGTWLLDPSNITISAGTTDMSLSAGVYSPSPPNASNSILNVVDLTNQLATSNIQVVTTSTGSGSGNITIATPITWSSSRTLTLTADPTTGQVQVNNAITANGAGGGLILSGNSIAIAAPITTVSGNVSFTGATSISINNAVSTGTGSQTYNSPVTLAASTSLTGGQISMPAVNLGANFLTINTTSASSAISGIVSGTGGLTKLGTGVLALAGANTYTGATLVSAGTLRLNNANALGSGVNQSVSTTVGSGATLSTFFTSATLGNTNSIFLTGTGVGATGALFGGTSTDTLTNPIVLNGNTTIGGTANLVLNGSISGSWGISKVGTGILSLSGVNTYTGTTTVSAGTLHVLNVDALGAANGGAISVGSSSTLSFDLAGGTLVNPNTITLNSNASLSDSAASGNTDTLTNPIVLGVGAAPSINSTISGAGLILSGNVTNSTGNIRFNSVGNISVSGIIGSSSGGIIKVGAGALNLSNANTYTGSTSINGGVLRVLHAQSLGTAAGGAIAVASGAILNINLGGGTLSNSNVISLTGTATLTSGTASGITDTLNNPITLVLGSPVIRMGNSGAIFILNGAITNNNASLTLNSPGDMRINGIIGSGSGSITKTGAGSVTLGAANTYTGATNINAGSIVLGVANALSSNTAVTLDNTAGALLDLNNFNDSIASLSGGGADGGNVLLGTGILTTGNSNINTNYAGTISGSGGLIKTGTGMFTLSGANTYTGATLVNSGTLRVTNANALGSGATQSSSLTIASGATFVTNFSTGTLGNSNPISLQGTGVGGLGVLIGSSNTDTLDNAIVLNADSMIGGTGNLVLNGVISDGGANYRLTKAGTNSLTLAGTNTYGGGTLLSSGTLHVTNPNGLGTTGSINIDGGILSLTLGGSSLQNTSTMTFNGGALTSTVASGSTDVLNNNWVLNTDTTVTTATANGTLLVNGGISGTGGLTKAGAGTLSLAGANTYGGGTTLSNGTLHVINPNGLGTSGAINIDGGTLSLALGGASLQNVSTMTFNGGALTSTVASGSTDVLNNNWVLNTDTTVTTATANGTLLVNGSISDTGGLTKAGPGILSLAGVNSYTGPSTVNAGTLNALHASALGGASGGAIFVASGATLGINLAGTTLANPDTITLSGNASISGNAASGVTDTLANLIIMDSAATPTLSANNAGSGLILSGNMMNSTGDITLNSVGDILVSGAIGGNSGGIIKTGSGILTLGAVNTYTGTTNINAGSLLLGVANALDSHTAVILADSAGALLDLNNFNTVIGSLAGGGTSGGHVLLGSGFLTTGGDNSSTVYSGSLSGTGGLIKSGSGTFSLAGPNSYTGSTLVNVGILRLANADALGSGVTQSSGTIVASGATLLTDNIGILHNQNQITLSGGILSSNALGSSTDIINNAIVLTDASEVNALNAGGTLVLNGTINGGFGLAVGGDGHVIFNNTIGNSSALSSLTVSSGQLTMNGGLVNTSGNQIYNAPVTLASSLVLNTDDGDIAFNNTVDGSANLTLETVSGDVLFQQAIGNSIPLLQILINHANHVTLLASLHANSLTQLAGTGISDFSGGINTSGAINVTTKHVSGVFSAPLATIRLKGTDSLSGSVSASHLIVNGQHGGTLVGTVTGTAAVGPGAQGVFTLNGQVIGSHVNPVPTPILPIFDISYFDDLGVILNGTLPYPYGASTQEDYSDLITYQAPVKKKKKNHTIKVNEAKRASAARSASPKVVNLLNPVYLGNDLVHHLSFLSSQALRLGQAAQLFVSDKQWSFPGVVYR